MSARCCPQCFNDRGLRKDIFPTLNSERGKCDFCGAAGVDVVPPQKLSDYFELLASAYTVDANGKPLVQWMEEDWALFSQNLSAAGAEKLLGEILDERVAGRLYSPLSGYGNNGLAEWKTIRDEMMHGNRWFSSVTFNTNRLENLLLPQLLADDFPVIWYRSRLSRDGRLYPIDKMGAPPERLAPPGRANPAGIPYLYLSSHPNTAVSEIRPQVGEVACVADFTIAKTLKIVDLRDPRILVSPFVLEDAGAIGQLRANIPFLGRLGDELARPVQPSSAAIDYIPSQYLCEFIKKCGYAGVIYKSSVSEDGINLALFNPEEAKGGDVEKYAITRVSIDTEKC